MMTVLEKAPDLEAWEGLYRAAVAFRNLKPWEWMWESDLFGVRNPMNGEIGYCIVTGAMNEHFSLAVYLGARGLHGYQQMVSGEVHSFEALFLQDCLMASFESRDCLESEDVRVVRRLGLRFRGPASWPVFRRYEPGYLPWFLNEKEILFLRLALEQAQQVVLRCRKNPESIVSPHEQSILVRSPQVNGNHYSWRDEWIQSDPFMPEVTTLESFNELRTQKIKRLNLDPAGSWEAGYFLAPIAMKEGDVKPFYPYVLLFVERRSGVILGLDVRHHSRYRREFQELLLSTIEKNNSLPREIRVPDEEAHRLLQPLAERLKIRVRKGKQLRRLEEARHAILEAAF